MNEYEPEIGQLLFGQPYKRYQASNLLVAALEAVREELERVSWNKKQEDPGDPFGNTGGSYKNGVFEVQAYSWDESKEQPYNFKYGDFEVSWYKYLGRGTSTNKEISPEEVEGMLDACLDSVRKEDVEL